MNLRIGFLMRRLGGALLLFATATSTHAQASGFNFTVAYGHGLIQHEETGFISTAVGLGYQQDLSPRFGLGLDAVLGFDRVKGIRSYEGIYSTKYFFSDNEGTALYMGTFIGVQLLKAEVTEYVQGTTGYATSRNVEASKLQVPVGIRTGLRGGLAGYFAELFVQAGYAIGNGKFYTVDDRTVKTTPLYFSMGFSFLGFGWDHKDR